MSEWLGFSNQTVFYLGIMIGVVNFIMLLSLRLQYATEKGTRVFLIGNGLFILFLIFVYLDGLSSNYYLKILIAVSEMLGFTFWIAGLDRMICLKVPMRFFALLNVINGLLLIVLYKIYGEFAYTRGVVSILLFILLILSIRRFRLSQKEFRSFRFLKGVFYGYAVMLLFRGGYRLFFVTQTEMAFDSSLSISFFLILNILFSIVINFSMVLANLDMFFSKIEEMNMKDQLTGVYNRRMLFSKLEEMIKLFERRGVTFSLAVVDLDHFKRINDTYGHIFGDEVLKRVSAYINDNIRSTDLLARFGGEEFVLLLSNDDVADSGETVNRLREGVESMDWNDPDIKVTFSAGLTHINGSEGQWEPELLIHVADEKLYEAKGMGRNRVVF